jgi:hypothetical protein
LTVLDEPALIGLFMSSLRLRILTTSGQDLGYAPEILGVGRILRTAPGWIAGATDRQIVLFSAARNAAQRVDLSLVEITHLAIEPDSFGLAIVQERDRVGRATITGRWIWRQELKTAVEELAIGPEGFCAITTDAGRLEVYDPAGNRAGSFQTEPAEPMGLIAAVRGAPESLAWITLAQRAQLLRGHDRAGKLVWESPIAWEGWQLHSLGSTSLVAAPDGRAQAFDGAGHLRAQGRASEGTKELFSANAQGDPRRVSRQGSNLICSDIEGRVVWRAVCDQPIRSVAVSSHGVAAIIGRALTWFPGVD